MVGKLAGLISHFIFTKKMIRTLFASHRPGTGPQHPGICWAKLVLVVLTALCNQPCWSDSLPPIANVVIGGAERRCSSFNGAGQSRDCLAAWDTVLAQDPAFNGLKLQDISFDADYPALAISYSLTHERVQAVRNIPDRLFDARRKAQWIDGLVQTLQATGPQLSLDWASLISRLLPLHANSAAQLTLSEGAMLRTALADPLPPYRRKLQGRSTMFSSDASSVAITHTFVAAARAANQGRKPLVGVVTASAGHHPFADHDINVFMLRSAGAEVVYLPLDGGFRQALDANDCSNLRYYYDSYANTNPERAVYHADLAFPDLAALQQTMCENDGEALNATLNRLNGIYFSGGNQARHLESLVNKDATGAYSLPSAQLAILQHRHAQGTLVVAGTSAGNHIQGGGQWRGKPVPMVGGGGPYEVVTEGFMQGYGVTADTAQLGQTDHNTHFAAVLYPLGGLGVFRFGVLDSHFSRRAREGRLVRATFDSGMDYGFGVDENTALLVSQVDRAGAVHFSVVGAGGVFIIDVRSAQAPSLPQKLFSLGGVRAHYLLPGDTASVDAEGSLRMQLSEQRGVLPAMPQAPVVVQDRLMDAQAFTFLNLAGAMGRTGAAQGFGTTHRSTARHNEQNAPYYSATLSRDANTQFRGAADLSDGSANAVAYTGLLVQLKACNGLCQPR